MKIIGADNLPSFLKSRRVPSTAQLELTSQCHLACPHCKSVVHDKHEELSTEQWVGLFGQLRQLGTTALTLTGGEIFLRPDLMDLCDAADGMGFKLTLFSTATLLNAQRVARLKRLKNLRRFAVSFYALRPHAHQAVTQADTFKKSLSNLLWLRREGLPAEAQTILLNPTWRDIMVLKSFFTERDIPFRQSLVVYPRDDGNLATRDMAAPTSVIAHLSRSLKPWQEQAFDCGGADPDGPICSVGRTVVAITARGEYLPCPSFRHSFGDIYEGDLPTLWKNGTEMQRILALRKNQTLCHTCNESSSCFHCPGLALAEAGNNLDQITYPKAACEVTYARKRGATIGR